MTEERNILIDLDSILDVKVAILHAIYPKGVLELADTYLKRKQDRFGNIPYHLFRGIYKKRNKQILSYALPTDIFKIIGEVYLVDRSDMTKLLDSTIMYINSYPYELTQKEQEQFKLRFEHILPKLSIEFVHLSPYDLTPNFIVNKEIYTIILYDGIEWLETQISLLNVNKDPLLNRSLIVPALIPNSTQYFTKKIDKHLFEEVTKMYNFFLDLVFVDAKYFSSRGLYKEKKKS